MINNIKFKLNQVKLSQKFSNILNYLLGLDSEISELKITEDGYLLARIEEDEFNYHVGTKQDLIDNIGGLTTCTNLTNEELTFMFNKIKKLELNTLILN